MFPGRCPVTVSFICIVMHIEPYSLSTYSLSIYCVVYMDNMLSNLHARCRSICTQISLPLPVVYFLFLLDQCYIVLHTVFSGAQGRTLYTSSDTCRSPAAPYPLDPEISRLERAGFYDWDC
jgi:hypothetical protein